MTPTSGEMTLAGAAAALRAGEIHAADLAEAAAAAHDPELGAYVAWRPEELRTQAMAADAAFAVGADVGPLQGIPVSVKDIYGLSGWPTHAGTPKEVPEAWRRDGPLVARARRQLAAFTGKTNTVEFAFSGLGTNPHWGSPRNPWDRARVAGGSSAGAGVSLAEGTALLAFGSDTAGSVRVPASMTGNVGLKTTFGRWPVGGIVPLSPSLDTAGILARGVADAALGFAALDAPEARYAAPPAPEADLGGLRIGLPEEVVWDDCDPGIAEGVRAALAELEPLGARLESFAFPEAEGASEVFREGGLAGAELHAFLSHVLPEWMETLDPNIRGRMEAVESLPATTYLQRKHRLAELTASADARLKAVDIIATPTVCLTPPRFEEVATADGFRAHNARALRNTWIGNALGLCALTLPVALDAAGMPVGLQLLARGGQDARLLDIALRIERALGAPAQRIGAPPR